MDFQFKIKHEFLTNLFRRHQVLLSSFHILYVKKNTILMTPSDPLNFFFCCRCSVSFRILPQSWWHENKFHLNVALQWFKHFAVTGSVCWCQRWSKSVPHTYRDPFVIDNSSHCQIHEDVENGKDRRVKKISFYFGIGAFFSCSVLIQWNCEQRTATDMNESKNI